MNEPDAQWSVKRYEREIVVVPIKDKKEHDDTSRFCKCKPKVIEQSGCKDVIVHHAFDSREAYEPTEC